LNLVNRISYAKTELFSYDGLLNLPDFIYQSKQKSPKIIHLEKDKMFENE